MNEKISTKDNEMYIELSQFLTTLNKKVNHYQSLTDNEKLKPYLEELKNLLKGQFIQLKEDIDNA